jgi:hypothetical protein
MAMHCQESPVFTIIGPAWNKANPFKSIGGGMFSSITLLWASSLAVTTIPVK